MPIYKTLMAVGPKLKVVKVLILQCYAYIPLQRKTIQVGYFGVT